MPGVLIIEAMPSLSRYSWVLVTVGRTADGWVPISGGRRKVRFKRPVRPGDQLCMESEVCFNQARIWNSSARALVINESGLRAEI